MANHRSEVAAALAVLENAVNRCMTEGVCTSEVSAALEYLATQATVKWPFNQFRRAIGESTKDGIEKEARRQVLMASLNGIQRRYAPIERALAISCRRRGDIFSALKQSLERAAAQQEPTKSEQPAKPARKRRKV